MLRAELNAVVIAMPRHTARGTRRTTLDWRNVGRPNNCAPGAQLTEKTAAELPKEAHVSTRTMASRWRIIDFRPFDGLVDGSGEKRLKNRMDIGLLAEAVRFELTVELPLRQFSRLLP